MTNEEKDMVPATPYGIMIIILIQKEKKLLLLGEVRLFGDVDLESVKEKASFITPVPGGVGPMTVTI